MTRVPPPIVTLKLAKNSAKCAGDMCNTCIINYIHIQQMVCDIMTSRCHKWCKTCETRVLCQNGQILAALREVKSACQSREKMQKASQHFKHGP